MISSVEAARSLYGAYRLARLDRGGLAFIDVTPEGALRSFWAAALTLPLYVLMIALTHADSPAPTGRVVLVEGVFYVIRWTAYPALMTYAVHLFDRAARLPTFIAAYNWSNVIAYVVSVPANLLVLSGVPLEGAWGGLSFALVVLVLAYQWFVTRTALDIGGSMATGLVMVDLALSLLISNLAQDLLQAGVAASGG